MGRNVVRAALLMGCVMGALMVEGRGFGAEGDQIVDGIGETALAARYTLEGNARDRSRDGHHARASATGAAFVDDAKYGKVLELSGGELTLPGGLGGAIGEADALTVTGWVWVGSGTGEVFTFGKGEGARVYAKVSADGDLVQTVVAAGGKELAVGGGKGVKEKWVHVAVMVDPGTKVLAAYADGVKVGESKEMKAGLEELLGEDAAKNTLVVGKGLKGKLRDVRVYTVALTPEQVGTIYKNGLAASAPPAAAAGGGTGAGPAAYVRSGPKLVGLDEVKVGTAAGILPTLPAFVGGKYEGGAKGPAVRVIWPSPKDNSAATKEGTYEVTGRVMGSGVVAKASVTVSKDAAEVKGPRRVVETFGLGEVVLNEMEGGGATAFQKNRDKFVKGLMAANPDGFLYMFRDAFGQPQPEGARPLGTWDAQTVRLRGHATGHYLSALAQAYAGSSYDPAVQGEFKKKMDYVIDTLHGLASKSGTPREAGGKAVADPLAVPPAADREGFDSNLEKGQIRNDYWNWGKGFVSAYPPDQFIMLEKGASYGGRNDQIWAPYYTLHKILAGLLDCYEVGGNEKALEVARGMGLWTVTRLKAVPTATRIKMWNTYIAGEYGGMNEVLARMYRLTKDERFLEGAKLFDNVNFFYGGVERNGGLAKNVDTLRGKHANQHIPQITGALETYRDSGEVTYFQIADHFWEIAVNAYSYSIGGVAGAAKPNNAECFTAEPNTLFENGFARAGQNETCATYNMLKLSRGLFMYEPEGKYMDYYERAIYNDILASVAENNPGNTYHIGLNPGARKQFGNARMDGFTCCNGTAIESSTKLQDSIYFKSADGNALYVNLYVPSTLTWKEKGMEVRQETRYPYADTTMLTVKGGGGVEMRVRVPGWATKGFFVKVNGKETAVEAKPGTYASVGQVKDGDLVELRMPMSFHLMPLMDQPNIASVLYGPVVLAAEEGAARTDWRPLALNGEDLGKGVKGDAGQLRFEVGDAVLRPFFEMYGRYSVYFNVKVE